MGHATRCVPIVRLLLSKGAEVIIAADGRPSELLKQEFPSLEFIRLKGYVINYPENGSMIWKMFLSIPKIMRGINKEHKALKQIIKEKSIDVVISDNRFGLWNKNIKSIFITHQLMIKAPFAEKLLHKINKYYINKYDECWMPDVEGENNLSGDLAHKYPLLVNAFFVGTLSRFKNQNRDDVKATYDVMAIISGPEPQRSIFEEVILKQLTQSNLKALVVCGKTEEKNKREIKGNVKILNHLNATEMQDAILKSEIIIARSGYSTIMDLGALGKKAIFIPTLGQTEQEYLAVTLMQKKIAFSQRQSEFNLQEALIESENYKGFEPLTTNNELEKRIDSLFK